MDTVNTIASGNTYIGIEFGSTRIKSVLINDRFEALASGSYQWENKLDGGYWSYSHDDIIAGLRASYASLKEDVRRRYGVTLVSTGAIGVSAMMHGYLAFDKDDNLLTPFRTWRNVTALPAAEALSEALGTHIPERWSIAHLYQAALDGEAHLASLKFINTLAGYVHYKLTGERVLGIGDASGMFPIENGDYDSMKVALTEKLLRNAGYHLELKNILPTVLKAGQTAGKLTAEGALLLDPQGDLKAGIPLCPPEGDAGTGMVATDSVRPSTGNISAGTSIFAMIVTERNLRDFHREIDMVTTPDGSPVAMIHCNNCSGDIDAWFALFGAASERITGTPVNADKLYSALLSAADDSDIEELPITFNYLSGESITEVNIGAPMVIRSGSAAFTLPKFIKSLLYSSLATLKLGMDTLTQENVKIGSVVAHGGFCKSNAGVKALSAALGIPVITYLTAGEGGAYGMAILAAYMALNAGRSLPDFLDEKVFSAAERKVTAAGADAEKEFDLYLDKYKKLIVLERKAGTLI